ncbi:unnamed protein product [Heterosigma akashiwo]
MGLHCYSPLSIWSRFWRRRRILKLGLVFLLEDLHLVVFCESFLRWREKYTIQPFVLTWMRCYSSMITAIYLFLSPVRCSLPPVFHIYVWFRNLGQGYTTSQRTRELGLHHNVLPVG